MFNPNQPRRLTLNRRHGELHVRVEASKYFQALPFLVMLAVVAVLVVVTDSPRQHYSGFAGALIVSVCIGYFLALYLALWDGLKVEDVTVSQNTLRWSRSALRWTRTLEVPVSEIRDVKAITKWKPHSNFVQINVNGRTGKIGQALSADECNQLAVALRHAVRLTGQSDVQTEVS